MPHAVETILSYTFKDPTLLQEALTHTSLTGAQRTYERLEFLGDRVAGCVVATLLYHHFPEDQEGDLALKQAHLVSRDFMAKVAGQLELAPHIILAKAEMRAGGRERSSLLADVMESLIAAVYLDGGMDAAFALVARLWTPSLALDAAAQKDSKSRLQEWAQAQSLGHPIYHLISQEGPAHAPHFTVEVRLNDDTHATGQGKSRRLAEQQAALTLLESLT